MRPKRREYSVGDVEYIIANYGKVPVGDIARHLGRPNGQIHRKASKLGVAKPLRRWCKEEDEFVRDSYGKLQLQEVAGIINRSRSEVSERSKALGLGTWRRTRRGTHSGRPIDGFLNGLPVFSHRRVAQEKLGRPISSVEIVHHIDFDILNNDPSNLHVFPDRAAHRSAHMSFERIVPDLVRNNIIFFNPVSGSYELCETSK